MYKLDILIFENGERYPILMGEDGMPHLFVTLYVTTELRTKMAFNTMVNRLKAILWLFEWEKKHARCLAEEFEQAQFLTVEDILSLRDHMKLNAIEQKNHDMGKAKLKRRVINLNGPASITTTVASVSQNHQYNRITAIAAYLHFLATVTNQLRNNPEVTKDIDGMSKALKKHRPKGRGRNVAEELDSNYLPDGLLDEFMDVANLENSLNPFKNSIVKLRNYLVFRLLRETGIRRGEVLSLEISYLELHGDNPFIWVRRKHDDRHDPRIYQPVSKTKERKFPIAKETAQLLDSYIVNERLSTPNSAKHPYLFITHRKCETQGQPISYSYFSSDIISKMKAVDERFSVIHAHTFRHEWNLDFSRRIDKINSSEEGRNIPPEEEAKMRKFLMGHSSEKSGDVYNQRHIREKAMEIILAEQIELEDKIKRNLKDE
ncbi:site-specific integrase [Shewanella sp. GutDb-MelDb]|uniref:site-specific integrase n=1 Tax=Shewanella sp. GutDb-MelDb TaxID=2058316 RepID=UPI0015E08785|nr:site-specific integrase [Shewanella sp. GutDb-MelDb]